MTAMAMTTVDPRMHAGAMANPADGNDNPKAQGTSITSNDFLTLLVTEMKNQDPTAQTDPNQYINQLVQVNSLQQLIEMNEKLSSALGTPTSGTGHAVTKMSAVTDGASHAAPAGSHRAIAGRGTSIPGVSGNLAPAAERVAHALGGHK